MKPAPPKDAYLLTVYKAAQFTCKTGANTGDDLTCSEDLILDDVYQLAFRTTTETLSILPAGVTEFRIASRSAGGTQGNEVLLESTLMFMSSDGGMQEALILLEVGRQGNTLDTYLMPLAPFSCGIEYSLVGIDPASARQKFAQVACMSFTQGTQITLASGAQRMIEDLSIGDKVLTRDDGAQEIRWIGMTTTRATGAFAPICIRAGTLHNDNDLLVSPDHRLFIYQRSDEMRAGRAELMVKARHLVNGDSVFIRSGGFIDYYQLLFDGHHVIYAEGIAAETLLFDTRNSSVLPQNTAKALREIISDHSDQQHVGLDIDADLLDRPDATDALRKASRG